MKRILLVGLLAGFCMYVWSSVAHMLLPLGEVGIQEISNEQPVISAMHASLGDSPGMFMFPSMSGDKDFSHYAAKLAASPSGVLIYHPAGTQPMARMFIMEFLIEVAVSILAVWLLAQTRLASFGAKVGFVTVVGITAAIMTNVQYWNWYGFPANYTLTYMLTQVVGFLVAGLVAAKMIRAPQAATAAA